MASTQPAIQESVEAVIISGARKGELIRVPEGERGLTPEESSLLDSLVADAWRMAETARAAAAAGQDAARRHSRGGLFRPAASDSVAEVFHWTNAGSDHGAQPI